VRPPRGLSLRPPTLAATLLWIAVAAGAASACGAQGRDSSGVVILATHSSPGGGSDVFLREMSPHLSRIIGADVVVENIAGGSGARAMAVVARARPDGAMFYATTPTFVYTSLLSQPSVTYSDLEPLVNVFFDPEVVYTASDSRFTTLQQVLEHARSGNGRWGAANPASLERQTLERLKTRTQVAPAIVTFEGGGDMMINVLNHTLDMGIGELQELRSQLDAGRIRLLGIVDEERLPQFPDVATLKEQGIDLAVRKFRGLAGPRGMPRDVVARWEAAIPKLLADPAYQRLYTDNGLRPGFMPQSEYAAFVRDFGRETEAFLKESGVIR
jgi:tripartite-type tricarboxylate transporter receptor subunit TctC